MSITPDTEETTPPAVSLGSEILTDEANTHYYVKDPVFAQGEVVAYRERDITDFTLRVMNRIQMGGDAARGLFEVEINGETLQIPSRVLESLAKWRAWCTAHGLGWSGRDADLIGLFSMLRRAEGPTFIGVDVIGLHGDSFVLPGEVVGEQGIYAFVPPGAGDLWSPRTSLVADSYFDVYAIELLAQLHRADVMTPILGWVAAAPLRSTCRKFPPLMVSGGSGFGKSTLIETVLGVFGFWCQSALSLSSGSTPYTISANCSSTNALPVWYDEYRGSTFGRDDTRHAIQQALRDAFDGASTEKGGAGADHMGITSLPVCAPLIVSGEDSLTEVSHIERAVIVNIPKDGRSKNALAALRAQDESTGVHEVYQQGIGRAYLEWLLEVRADPDRRWWLLPPDCFDRATFGREVAEWGYRLLCTFVLERSGPDYDMPKYDGSRIKADQIEASGTNPIMEAIDEARSARDKDGNQIVWNDDDGATFVRVGALVDWTKRNRAESITLPGGAQAVTRWLRETYGATSEKVDHMSARVRVSWWPKAES